MLSPPCAREFDADTPGSQGAAHGGGGSPWTDHQSHTFTPRFRSSASWLQTAGAGSSWRTHTHTQRTHTQALIGTVHEIGQHTHMLSKQLW